MTPRSMDKTASRVSDARLADFTTPSSQTRGPTMQECIDMANELQSLRSLSSDSVSDGSKGVRVKPLEWHRVTQGFSLQRAATTFGDYRIWVGDDGGWFWAFNDQKHSDGAEGSEDAAKASVNADYRQRILSALYSGTGGQQPVAWQGLSIATEKLVDDFASALKTKLRAAEIKYSYDDGWRGDDWETKCRRDLLRHVLKGDPLDVAAYAAFCWHHQWPTTPTPLDVAHFQLVALPPLYPSPTEPKAGVVSEDMVVAALKGLVLLKDLFDASDRNQADAYYILAKQDGAWGNARSALTAALPNTTGEAE